MNTRVLNETIDVRNLSEEDLQAILKDKDAEGPSGTSDGYRLRQAASCWAWVRNDPKLREQLDKETSWVIEPKKT